jgi:hypothetical protein
MINQVIFCFNFRMYIWKLVYYIKTYLTLISNIISEDWKLCC